MPLILASEAHAPWLDPKGQNYKTVTPTPEEMKTYWVSPRMNSPRNADPDAARPLTASVKSIAGGYPLPQGLPEGATVKIRAFDGGFYDVEFEGKHFKAFMGCVAFKGETRNLL